MWVSMILAAVLSVQMFIALDQALPDGMVSSFEIDRIEAVDKTSAVEAISKVAKNNGASIEKIAPSQHDSLSGRDLFVFGLGEKDFSMQGKDYPSFSRQMLVRSYPASAITTQDLRGSYAANIDSARMQKMMKELQDNGIFGRVEVYPFLNVLSFALGQQSLFAACAIDVLTLLVAFSYAMSSRRKTHALKTLHGYTSGHIVRDEIADCSLSFVIGIAVLAVCGLAFLGVYNHFHQLLRFLPLVCFMIVLLYLFCLFLVLVLGGAATLRLRIPQVVNGEQMSLRDGLLSFVVQTVVLVLIFATGSGTMWRIDSIDRTIDSLSQWNRIPRAYALRLGINVTTQEQYKSAKSVLSVVRNMDREGKVLMSVYDADPATHGDVAKNDVSPFAPGGVRSLSVNPRYLQLQPVYASDGKRVTVGKTGSDDFTLLIPQSYQGDENALLGQYVRYFKSWCTEDGGSLPSCSPHGSVVRTRTGQRISTFNGTLPLTAEDQQVLDLRDPVVAVVSVQSNLLIPDLYLDYISTDDLLFFDAQELDRLLKQYGIRQNFQGIDNAADSVNVALQSSRREQTGDVFGLALGVMSLIVSVLACAAVYCERRRRISFVELIHGYSFIRRHGSFLLVALTCAVISMGVTFFAAGMSHVRDVVFAVFLFAGFALLLLSALRVYEAKFRADDIKRP
jgi:putative ABC transport system permease protein